jgi:hypothetical protein
MGGDLTGGFDGTLAMMLRPPRTNRHGRLGQERSANGGESGMEAVLIEGRGSHVGEARAGPMADDVTDSLDEEAGSLASALTDQPKALDNLGSMADDDGADEDQYDEGQYDGGYHYTPRGRAGSRMTT